MNEQTQKLEVIKKRCNTSMKVIRVLQVLVVIGIVGALIGAFTCIAFKDVINPELAKQVASGNATVDDFAFVHGILNFKINYESAFQAGNYATPLAINCFIAVMISCASLYLLTMFYNIFKMMTQEENPFSDTVLANLKKCFIILTIIIAIFAGIGPGVIAGLFGWCMYSIFEYGKVIQMEVDETL